MNPVLLVVAAFVAMEPITYAAHRWVMHGPGMVLHRSHHRASRLDGARGLEANDGFPVMFASIVGAAMAIGFNVDGWFWLVWIGIGVTSYGMAYAMVHDVYVHRRLRILDRFVPVRGMEYLAAAHLEHHRGGGEPYGMLAPTIRPSRVRRRVQRNAASGSTPSQLPLDA
ncbi:MAG: sterol desaturase family protein [Ilumatobacteraceae bacterium]